MSEPNNRLIFTITDAIPGRAYRNLVCYDARFFEGNTTEVPRDGADITRSLESGGLDVRLLINDSLSFDEVEQVVMAILEDIKINGLHSIEKEEAATAKQRKGSDQ